MTPEKVLDLVVEGINAGDLDSLITLYEPHAASQPGQLARSTAGIRESLRCFIDMHGNLDLKVKRVLRASDLALRQQPDQTWRFVIDNPWGTD